MIPRTMMLAEACSRMSVNERAYVDTLHAHYIAQFETSKAIFAQPEGTAAGVHDAIDRAVAHTFKTDKSSKRVACTKACAHCCHIQVDITEPEARLLVYAAEEAGLMIDADRLRVQRDALRFFELPLEQRRCVFLKPDNLCAVYEHRPGACRKYFAVDSAERCDTVKHPGAEVLNFVSIEAECIQSAGFDAWPSGPLPQMLLEWLP